LRCCDRAPFSASPPRRSSDLGSLRLNPVAYRERRITASGERGGGVFTGLVLPVLFVVIGGLGIPGPASHTDREAIGGRGRRMLAPLAGIVASLVLAVLLAAAVPVLRPGGSVADNRFVGGAMCPGVRQQHPPPV